MNYLTVKEVLLIHYVAIKQFGGSHGIKDLGLIESAVARPQAGFGRYEAYPDLFEKAAVLTYSLVKNHGFVDGNKRTDAIVCGIFLKRNGYRLQCTQKELVESAVSLTNGSWSERTFALWLREHSREID